METETVKIRKRQPMGIDGKRISFVLPPWMLEVIDQEAEIKSETRSKVISYLIYSGLKAHTGEFVSPGRNTIKKNWQDRGRKWGMK